MTALVFAATGSDQQAPQVPTGLSGSGGNGQAFLFWDANPDADLQGYNVYRSRCAAGPYRGRVNEEPIEVPEYLDTGADNGVTYTYAVAAVDRSGNESALSGKVSVTVGEGGGPQTGEDKSPPSPPILIQAR